MLAAVHTILISYYILVKHKEDLGYSAIVAKFPVDKDTIEVIQQTHAYKIGVGAPSTTEIDEETLERSNDDFIIHRVALTDTLMGIGLYYQVKVCHI